MAFQIYSCIFLKYTDGQTSSGKTHTMLGGPGQPGILEMATEEIFNLISENPNRMYLMRVSFVEIYNEIIRDLLSYAADNAVMIREDPRKGVYCEASETQISDFESVIKCLKKGLLFLAAFYFLHS